MNSSALSKVLRWCRGGLAVVLSTVIPRQKDLWVVGGHRGYKYAGNSMFFFKYCIRHTSKRLIWITRSRQVRDEVREEGHEAYLHSSCLGLWYGLRAGWFVYDVSPKDIGVVARNAKCLNLWHGVPLKDIGFIHPKNKHLSCVQRLARRITLGKSHSSNTFLVHPSKLLSQHILAAFDIPEGNVIHAQLPRNIVFTPTSKPICWAKAGDLPTLQHVKKLRLAGSRVLGYFPTWRGDGSDRFMAAGGYTDIEQFNALMQAKNCYMLTKLHDILYPEYHFSVCAPEQVQMVQKLRSLSNVIVLDYNADATTFLPQCDFLVTDYSSIFFDYLLADRPTGFLAYDLREYERSWGFNFDYESFVPGPISTNLDSLKTVVAEWTAPDASNRDPFSAKRAQCRAQVFEFTGSTDFIVAEMERRARTPR